MHADSINLDTTEEAHAHLSATGLLSQHSQHIGNSHATYNSGAPAAHSGTISLPMPSPGPTGVAAAARPLSPPPPSLTSSPKPTSGSRHVPARDDEHESRAPTSSGYRQSKMRAVAEGQEPQAEGWSSSSVNWHGMDSLMDDDAQDGAVEDGTFQDGAAQGGQGSIRSVYTPTCTTPGSRGSRRSAGAAFSAQSPHAGRPHTMRTPRRRELNPSLPAIPSVDGPMFPALDGVPSVGGGSADVSMSIDIAPSHGATPRHDGSQVLGYPTVSSPLEPGPYHKANAQLRRQLPHLNVEVTVQTSWDHIFLTILAFFAFVTYIAVRIYYLLSGRTALYTEQNINVAYSYLVLVAEFFLGALGFYGHQMYWKQNVEFSPMDSNTLRSISEVRPLRDVRCVICAAESPPRAVSWIDDVLHAGYCALQALAAMVLARMQDVAIGGVRQTVHVMITTYTEPADTVRECLIRLLVAPEPVYMEKVLYVCDDGHAKSEGPRKRAMVEELRVLGTTHLPIAVPVMLFCMRQDLTLVSGSTSRRSLYRGAAFVCVRARSLHGSAGSAQRPEPCANVWMLILGPVHGCLPLCC